MDIKDTKDTLNSTNRIHSTNTNDLGVDWKAFYKVLSTRRSVRIYDGTPIPEQIVNDCLDAALLAPNSSNLQPWEFHWVRSSEKKQKLVEACLSQPAAKTAAELIVCVARTKTWNENRQRMLEIFKKSGSVPKSTLEYYTKIIPIAYTQGPLGLIGFLKKVGFWLRGLTQPTPREPTSFSDMKIWATKSTALACENLMLAFRAHGFDSCPMEGMDSSRVKKILNLPNDALVVMVVSAGKRAANGVYGPQIRLDRSLFVKEC